MQDRVYVLLRDNGVILMTHTIVVYIINRLNIYICLHLINDKCANGKQKCVISNHDYPGNKYFRNNLRPPRYCPHQAYYLVPSLDFLVEVILRSDPLSVCRQQGHCDVITRFFSFFLFAFQLPYCCCFTTEFLDILLLYIGSKT